MSRILKPLLAVAVVTGAAACSGGQPGAINAAGTQALAPQVRAVRDAAASGKYNDLRRQVNELLTLVDQQQAAGNVTARRATAIADAADVLLTDASPSPKPTPSSTTVSPVPTTESPTPTPTTQSPTPTPVQTTPPPPTTLSPTPTTTPAQPQNQQEAVQPVTTTSTSASASPTAAATAAAV
jgi:hypothetical protein